MGIGATIGKVGIITNSASCNQQIIGIVGNHQVIGRFLTYLFKIYEDVIPGIAKATTLPILDQVKVSNFPIVIPPMSEQKSICEFLDKKSLEIKELIAEIDKQIDTLYDYRRSLINECVTGKQRVTDMDVRRVSSI